MENETPDISEKTGYSPRPAWQIWAARIALVLFLIVLFFYYRSLLNGGM